MQAVRELSDCVEQLARESSTACRSRVVLYDLANSVNPVVAVVVAGDRDLLRVRRRDRLALRGLEEGRSDAAARALANDTPAAPLLLHARVRSAISIAARVIGP